MSRSVGNLFQVYLLLPCGTWPITDKDSPRNLSRDTENVSCPRWIRSPQQDTDRRERPATVHAAVPLSAGAGTEPPLSTMTLWFFLLWALAVAVPAAADVVSVGPTLVNQGAFQYYFDNTTLPACRTMLFLGVGTAMKTSEYSILSSLVVEHSKDMVVVVVDHNPRNPFGKQNPDKLLGLLNELAGNLARYVPVCGETKPQMIVGGHSASGQAAVDALSILTASSTLQPIGFLGLAPYQLSRKMKIGIPTLVWDSSEGSCKVDPKTAGLMAYEISNGTDHVFYQVKSVKSLLGGPHCIFTDSGCLGMCCEASMVWVRESVAKSVSVFVEAINSSAGFVQSAFESILSDGTKLLFESRIREPELVMVA